MALAPATPRRPSGRDLHDRHRAANQLSRLVEHRLLRRVKRQFDDALDAAAAQLNRHAKADVVQAIFSIKIDRGWEDLVLVVLLTAAIILAAAPREHNRRCQS